MFPIKKGFTEFVNVERIQGKNDSFNITGFSIDVFRAALKLLSFKDDDVKFQPFMNIDKNESSGTYDELIQKIPNKVNFSLSFLFFVSTRIYFWHVW